MPEYLRFVILLAAGWIKKDQQKIIDCLLEEIGTERLPWQEGLRRRIEEGMDHGLAWEEQGRPVPKLGRILVSAFSKDICLFSAATVQDTIPTLEPTHPQT